MQTGDEPVESAVSDAADATPGQDPALDHVIAVARFRKPEQAYMAAARLAEAGIEEATVEPHAAYDWFNHFQIGLQPKGVALLAPESRAREAAEVLAETEPDVEPPDAVENTALARTRRAVPAAAVSVVLVWLIPFAMWYLRSLRRQVREVEDRLDDPDRDLARTRLRRAWWIIGISIAIHALIIGTLVVAAVTSGHSGPLGRAVEEVISIPF